MIEERVATAQMSERTSFAIGETVALRSDPRRVGVVTSMTPSNRETRYGVFIDGRMETLYASQLIAADIAPSAIGATSHRTQRAAYRAPAHRAEPRQPVLAAGRPHRLHPVPVQAGPQVYPGGSPTPPRRRRGRRREDDRGRIAAPRASGAAAAALGLGRMLEGAGCRGEMASGDAPLRRGICHASGVELRHCLDQTDLDGEWPERYARAILPFSLVNENLLNGYPSRSGSRSKGLATLDTPPRFDLLIVDEAHNARNTDTNLHQGLRLLADNAEAVVLLTATPVQLGTGDLFSLLNLLRPDLVIDRPTFERMADPNGAINAAVAAIGRPAGWQAEALDHLTKAAMTDWGRVMLAPSPEYRALVAGGPRDA